MMAERTASVAYQQTGDDLRCQVQDASTAVFMNLVYLDQSKAEFFCSTRMASAEQRLETLRQVSTVNLSESETLEENEE